MSTTLSVLPFRKIVILFLMAALASAGEKGERESRAAQKAATRGDYVDAYLKYSQAIAKDPENAGLWDQARAALELASATGQWSAPRESEPSSTSSLLDLPQLTPEDYAEISRLRPPPVLRLKTGTFDFDVKGDSKALFERVARTCGVEAVFDGDYQPTKTPVFRMEQVTCREALHAAETVTAAFFITINERALLVAKDTVQKRSELEPAISLLVPFPEPLSQQEVQEAARAIQSTFDITKVAIDNAGRQVLFRDRASRLRPALELFHQIMAHRAQIVAEVEFLGVSDTKSTNYGMILGSAFQFVWLGDLWNNKPAYPTGFAGFASFGGGKSLIGVGVTGAQLIANSTDAVVKSIIRTEMRGVDGQAMQIHVGDRYPIITQGYYGATPGNATVYTPPPTITWEDLGVVIKVTPRVHGSDEVSIALEAEYKILTGETLNGIPVISSRKFASQTRMKFGETIVIAGLVKSDNSRTTTGIPGLVMLPPFRSNTTEKSLSEVLLTITPRLVSQGLPEVASPLLWVGTETRPLTP
jgi:general secretion pathway protein D